MSNGIPEKEKDTIKSILLTVLDHVLKVELMCDRMLIPYIYFGLDQFNHISTYITMINKKVHIIYKEYYYNKFYF